MINDSQKGVTLYFTLIIMAILLAAVFGINTIIVSQIKSVKEMGNSVIAFYAADSGAETALYNGKTGFPASSPYTSSLNNGAFYVAQAVATTSPSCDGQWYCIESVGTFENIQRRVKITR